MLLMLAAFFAVTPVTHIALAKPIMPVAGIGVPISSTSDQWNNGFVLGLHFPLKNSRHGDWSIVTSYQQMSPNAAEILKTGGRKMKVEQSEGVGRVVELSVISDRSLWESSQNQLSFGIQYGAGIYLVEDEKIHLRGAYQTPLTALTREIYRKGETSVVPGVSIGCLISVSSRATVSMRLQHLFTAETARDFLFIGIGFLPY